MSAKRGRHTAAERERELAALARTQARSCLEIGALLRTRAHLLARETAAGEEAARARHASGVRRAQQQQPRRSRLRKRSSALVNPPKGLPPPIPPIPPMPPSAQRAERRAARAGGMGGPRTHVEVLAGLAEPERGRGPRGHRSERGGGAQEAERGTHWSYCLRRFSSLSTCARHSRTRGQREPPHQNAPAPLANDRQQQPASWPKRSAGRRPRHTRHAARVTNLIRV
jgi:hypothetical protein